MELSWSTFVLEIINFLVLVWILKRFLYKPVLDVISRRHQGIEQTRADADALQAEAKTLQQQYENRLADWNKERQQLRETLTLELEVERKRKLEELQTELDQQREKLRVAEASRQQDTQRKIEQVALNQAAEFAARLLQQIADANTEERLVELVISQLTQLPGERLQSIRNHYGQTPDAIQVVSAFELKAQLRDELEKAIQTLTGQDLPTHYQLNSDLIAGLRITVGAWVLAANLEDELRGLADISALEKRIDDDH